MKSLPLAIERGLADVKALQVQTALEYDQKLRQEITPSCAYGCVNCCHHPFLVTVIEGLLIYRWLSNHGYWTAPLRRHLKINRDKTLGLSFEVWVLSNITCPLVGEKNECIAYETRPLHCRVTYSTGDPLMCHPHELGDETRLLPSSETIIEYNIKLQEISKRLEIPTFLVPLSEALLLGESFESHA